LRDNFTDEDRRQLSEMAKHSYANRTKAQKKKTKERHAANFRNIGAAEKERRRVYQLKRYRENTLSKGVSNE
jgi:hypothetical protein